MQRGQALNSMVNILHRTPRRLRLRLDIPLTASVRAHIERELREQLHINRLQWYSTTRTLVVYFKPHQTEALLLYFKQLDKDAIREAYQAEVEEPPQTAYETIRRAVVNRLFYKTLVPQPLRYLNMLYAGAKYLTKAYQDLRQGALTVEVLDATAITVSLLRGEFETASSIHFLLTLSDQLEANTLRASYHHLKDSLALSIDRVWKQEADEFVEVAADTVKAGDIIQVYKGHLLPFDGLIQKGNGAINEASLTGEAFPVHKHVGDEVYANTVLEEGELHIQVTRVQSETAIAKLVDLITQSESLKSSDEKLLEVTANRLVKFNFLGLGLTYALTRNIEKALSFLLVDFSCALRLIGPLNYLTAMKDAADEGVVIKGSKFIENFDAIDTFVFDKTGTLTTSLPEVAKVVPLNGYEQDEVIRIGACLEEHFYHPIADAMVRLAEERNIEHEEMHNDINYIVAHGIESSIDGKRVVIGSKHFIVDDEQVALSPAAQKVIDAYETDYNLLYLAYDNQLIGIFCIDALVRPDAQETLAGLQALGKRIILLTGDQANRAEAFAKQIGIQFDEVYAEVLPEEKYAVIQQEQEAGHRVAMIGDGINDSAALSLADIGLVLKETSDLARQVSDIIIYSDRLTDMFTLIALSRQLTERLRKSQAFILGFNGGLIGAGLVNLLSSNTIAFLHNFSTFAMAFISLRPFGSKEERALVLT